MTETSDAEYVAARNAKPFYLLIVPTYYGGRWVLGWMWAARLSEDGAEVVRQKVAEGARLVRTTDERWLRGARIKRYGGVSLPTKSPEDAEELRRIFTEAP